MTGTLAAVAIIIALVVAAWGLITALLNRPAGLSHLIGLALVEVVLLIQFVVAVVKLVGGERPAEFATFIGYLIASLIVLPVGGALAFAERSRWGSGIVAFACLVIPVLIVRMQQVWNG